MAIWLSMGGFDLSSSVGTNHLFLRPIYLVSMDQVSMGICGPDIYGYLWTRYLWVSVDQVSMDQVSMDQVPRYLGT